MEIRRNKDGFITGEQSEEMFYALPIVVGLDGDEATFELITESNWDDWFADLEKPDRYNFWQRVAYVESPEKVINNADKFNNYTHYCTEDQTITAWRLDAPVMRVYTSGGHSDLSAYLYKKPTTQQMMGWLREQGMWIDIQQSSDDWDFYVNYNHNEIAHGFGYGTYQEAELAAIDAALDYLKGEK